MRPPRINYGWNPIETAPLEEDIALQVTDGRGGPYTLQWLCRRTATGWINSRKGNPLEVTQEKDDFTRSLDGSRPKVTSGGWAKESTEHQLPIMPQGRFDSPTGSASRLLDDGLVVAPAPNAVISALNQLGRAFPLPMHNRMLVRVRRAPPRSPAQLRFPSAVGIVFDFRAFAAGGVGERSLCRQPTAKAAAFGACPRIPGSRSALDRERAKAGGPVDQDGGEELCRESGDSDQADCNRHNVPHQWSVVKRSRHGRARWSSEIKAGSITSERHRRTRGPQQAHVHQTTRALTGFGHGCTVVGPC
jgi:hypothetical protein